MAIVASVLPGACEEELTTWTGKDAKEKFRAGGTFCSDGSGGEHGSDKTLRRCGWGLTLCTSTAEVIGCWGALAGKRQTVPRSELFGLLMAITLADGPVVLWTDHKNIVDHFERLGQGEGGGLFVENGDLWSRIRKRMREKGRQIDHYSAMGQQSSKDLR